MTALATVAGACVGTNDAGQNVQSSVPREPGRPALVEPAARHVNGFAIELYGQVAPGVGNVMLAPWPIQRALAMARVGATDDTLSQFDQALRAQPPEAFDLEMRSGRVDFRSASALWAQRGTTFVPTFLDTLARYYGAGVRVADFRSDAEASRRILNTWVGQQTDGRIPDLLSRGSITQYTRLVATTAFELQAPWLVPFDAEQTRPAPFHGLDGSVSDAPSLGLQAPFASGIRYGTSDAYEAVELPYLGEELSMVLIAPTQGTFTNFERNLSAEVLDDVVADLRSTAVDLRVPQFGFTTALNLNNSLSALGLTSAFDAAAADFSGITTDEPLSISDVAYQGFVSIDAEGSQAAAATVRKGDEPTVADARRVTIDRPFIFAVRDRSTGLLYELGRVVEAPR
jgi:serpin B